VNIVVHDSHGRPVDDLKKEDFSITEQGKGQPISFFTMTSADRSATPAAPLPPHVFSNVLAENREVPTSVTVVLLDLLNTSWTDQLYARKGLLKFFEQLQPQDRVALFALGRHSLTLLHDYTTDSASLIARLQKATGEIPTALDASTVARRLIDYTRPVTSIDPELGSAEPSSLALDRLVEEVVADRRANGPQGIEWVTELNTIPPIRAHAAHLRAMLGHLINNSIEAMPKQAGTIWVGTSTDSRGWVVVDLRDSGQGMEGETMVRAVEPFFSSKPGHLGVGLSIANGIWRRHRGTLSLRSQPGEGTAVRLCVEPYHP